MATIGKNIMEARKRLGLTQEELAARVGYKTKSAINKIEMGIRDLPQRKIVQFAEALETTPAALMGWVKEETSKKNDKLVKLVALMRRDEELLDMVDTLTKLSPEKRASMKQLLSVLGKE